MDIKVKSPQQVKQYANEEAGKKLVFDCKWEVASAPPNTLVGISAVSRVAISGTSAEVRIYQLLGGKETAVEVLNLPFSNNKVEGSWRTKPVKAGNFQEGVYHFRVSVNGYTGETVGGLKLSDAIAKRNESSFEAAKPKPKVVF